MNCFSDDQLSKISKLIKDIEELSDVEKLFLYLQLPCGKTDLSEGKSNKLSNNGNGQVKSVYNVDLFAKKPDQETTQTYTWILSHLEVDPNVSLPKQEVYDEYRAFCQANRFEPLCVADFGKAMKHAFPCIKPRRLGQRGNSRYCYSGLRKKYKIQAPNLPDLIEPTFCIENDCSQSYNQILQGCRDNPDQCPLNNTTILNQQQQQPNKHDFNHPYANSDDTFGAAINLKIDSSHQANNPYNYSSTKQINLQDQQQQPQQPQQPNQQPNQQYHQPLIGQLANNEPRYYGGLIQQPGTPDDDDYSHNHYQDFNPMSTLGCSQIFSKQAFPVQGQSSNSAPSSNNTSLVGSSFYQVPQASSLLKNSTEQVVPQATTNFLSTGTEPTASLSGPSQLNTNHFESSSSCNSPFLSPASTPYPNNSSQTSNIQHQHNFNNNNNHHHQHLINNSLEIQDYYQTNDFVPYS